ncbi:hypothetical protein PAEPH01_2052 [Pancytospora epiphaga]|nr:hypothetical protein PAEPH01_2052 [Pancytospora epiphaga]
MSLYIMAPEAISMISQPTLSWADAMRSIERLRKYFDLIGVVDSVGRYKMALAKADDEVIDWVMNASTPPHDWVSLTSQLCEVTYKSTMEHFDICCWSPTKKFPAIIRQLSKRASEGGFDIGCYKHLIFMALCHRRHLLQPHIELFKAKSYSDMKDVIATLDVYEDIRDLNRREGSVEESAQETSA